MGCRKRSGLLRHAGSPQWLGGLDAWCRALATFTSWGRHVHAMGDHEGHCINKSFISDDSLGGLIFWKAISDDSLGGLILYGSSLDQSNAQRLKQERAITEQQQKKPPPQVFAQVYCAWTVVPLALFDGKTCKPMQIGETVLMWRWLGALIYGRREQWPLTNTLNWIISGSYVQRHMPCIWTATMDAIQTGAVHGCTDPSLKKRINCSLFFLLLHFLNLVLAT